MVLIWVDDMKHLGTARDLQHGVVIKFKLPSGIVLMTPSRGILRAVFEFDMLVVLTDVGPAFLNT